MTDAHRPPVSSAAAPLSTTRSERVPLVSSDTSGRDTLTREGPALKFVHRWRSTPGLVFLAVALSSAVTWWPFMLTGHIHWAISLVVGGVSLAMLWGGLAGVLNRSTVEISHGLLTVRHGPIPFLKNRELELSKVVQLYITTRTRKADRGTRTITIYDVIVENKDGGDFPLVKGLEDGARARDIERVIEQLLEEQRAKKAVPTLP